MFLAWSVLFAFLALWLSVFGLTLVVPATGRMGPCPLGLLCSAVHAAVRSAFFTFRLCCWLLSAGFQLVVAGSAPALVGGCHRCSLQPLVRIAAAMVPQGHSSFSACVWSEDPAVAPSSFVWLMADVCFV